MATVEIRGQAALTGRTLGRRASATVTFTPRPGVIRVATPLATAVEPPTPKGKPGGGGPLGGDDLPPGGGGPGPGGGGGVVLQQDVRVEVALFPPGSSVPGKSKTFRIREVGQSLAPLELGVREEQAGRAWRCRFRNVGPGEIRISATVSFVEEVRTEPDPAPVVDVDHEVALPATFLRPGDVARLEFAPQAGTIEFTMVGFDQDLPERPGKTLDPDGDGVGEPLPIDQDVRVKVELIAPGTPRPVATEDFVSTTVPLSAGEQEPVLSHTVDEARAGRTWRIRLTNRGGGDIRCAGTVRFLARRLRSELPLRVLNNGLRQVVAALGLRVRLDGREAFIGVSEELEAALGELIGSSLRVPLEFSGEIRDLKLVTVGLRARPRDGRPAVIGHAAFETTGEEIEGYRFLGVLPVDIDLTRLALTVTVELHTIGRPGSRQLDPHVEVDVDAEAFGRALSVASVGDVSDRVVAEIKPRIEQFATSQAFRDAVRSFAGETLVRLVAPGHSFEELRAESGRFVVLHQPPDPDEPDGRPPQPATVEFPRSPDEEPRTLPAAEREGLARIGNIVVLMQENRSFDQLLGYLRHPDHGLPRLQADPARDVPDGLRGGESNPRSLGGPAVASAPHPEEVSIGRRRVPATRIPFDPDHGHDAVIDQIAGGDMSGFVDSFVARHPNVDPALVMGFYTDRHLPVYDRLAARYTICDRWFCAHPGPTHANRFATLSGHIPELGNFRVGDPILGYLRMTSVFDALSEAGVDWAYYEGDIGFIRMYDRYRIDDRRVIPFDDPDDGFLRRAELGTLPPVTFIDPNFADVPPGVSANDDHPPADLREGQLLVGRIHDALVSSPQWIDQDGTGTLFVVVYDEHGGFYDHVPPPGTDASGAPPVPPIHPQGKPFYGPRVPAFVVSPHAEPGRVDSTVFDHTSLLATILRRFVGEIPAVFGPRPARAATLGAVLSPEVGRRVEAIGGLAATPPDDRLVEVSPDRESFHAGIRRLGIPLLR